MHRQADINTLDDRRSAQLLIHAFKLTLNPTNLANAPRATRLFDGPILKPVGHILCAYKRSVLYKATHSWNALTVEERLSENLS